MATIKHKRGTRAALDASPGLQQGELGLCTDTGELFIGNNGNHPILEQVAAKTLMGNIGSDKALPSAIPAADILKMIGAASNPNLLDNWDFRNPVNQRGETVYEGITGYVIDRWKLPNSTHQKCELVAGGVKVGAMSGTSLLFPMDLQQIILLGDGLIGETVTFSFETIEVNSKNCMAIIAFQNSSGTNISSVSTAKATVPGIISHTFTIPQGCARISIQLRAADTRASGGDINSSYAIFSRVKLELGSISTLENDPPMDYATELAKCQRYYIRLKPASASSHSIIGGCAATISGTQCISLIPTPVTMRINPTPNFNGNIAFFEYSNGEQIVRSISSVAVGGVVSNGIYCTFTITGSQIGRMGFLRTNNDSKAFLEFSADL